MRDGNLVYGLGRQGLGRQDRELLEADPDEDLREQCRELRLEPDRSWQALVRRRHAIGEQARDLLVGAILQQSGEEQVSGLEEREVLLIFNLAARKQPCRLEVEQGGCDNQEAARLIEIPRNALCTDVADELIGDPMQGKLGYLELVLGDERQEQLERSLEIPDVHREDRGLRSRLAVRRSDRLLGSASRSGHRARTSLASWRYASAPVLSGA
ncbi:unannotated protein [freshwater metagenome]|uniref:Unannotated protein n=1 Tax=freshwater metagenome TaxID=449393 RepID=A0A6J6T601_9ZZZZ